MSTGTLALAVMPDVGSRGVLGIQGAYAGGHRATARRRAYCLLVASDTAPPSDTPYQSVQDFAAWAAVLFDASDVEEKLDRLTIGMSEAKEPSITEMRRRLIREAAITTGAVEELYELAIGQTRTIAVGDDNWARPLLVQGADKLHTFHDQVAAYEYALELSRSADVLSELTVRELHDIACRHQETYTAYREDPRTNRAVPHQVRLRRGEYKNNPNHVRRRDGSILEYCPPLDTPSEIRRFVEQLQSGPFDSAHPLVKATYAHYGLVHIHPFADGNGRVARVLSSYYLFDRYHIPLIVYPDRRMTYFQALDGARVGARERMVEYVTDRVSESLARALQELQSLTEESLSDELMQLRSALASASEISIEAATELATGVLHEFAREVEQTLIESTQDVGGALEHSVNLQHYGPSSTLGGGYSVSNSANTQISLSRPAKLTVNRTLYVGVANDLASRFVFRVATRAVHTPYDSFDNAVDIRFEDVNPTLSEGARPRIKLAAEATVRSMLRELNRNLAATLRQSGHGEP